MKNRISNHKVHQETLWQPLCVFSAYFGVRIWNHVHVHKKYSLFQNSPKIC